MVDNELYLLRTPEQASLQQAPTAEKLVNTYLGKVHTEDALRFLNGSEFDNGINGAVDTAQILVSVDISPVPILKMLKSSVNEKPYNSIQGIMSGISRIYALMGDYEAVERTAVASLLPTSDLLFAAKTQIAKGENPSKMLKAVEVRLETYGTKNPLVNCVYSTLDYARIGSLYARSSLRDEATRTFAIAEGVIDKSRALYDQGYAFAKGIRKNDDDAKEIGRAVSDLKGHHESAYHLLASIYAEVGWFEDALRVVNKLDEDNSCYFSTVIENITNSQLEHGLTDAAVETARKLGGVLYVKTLAQKAAIDATHGKPYMETIQAIEKIIIDAESDEGTKQIHPQLLNGDNYVFIQGQLGVATAKGGDLEATKEHFNKAWVVIQETAETKKEEDDPFLGLFRPSLILSLAEAVDDAGLDASRLLKDALSASNAIYDKFNLFDEQWQIWSKTVIEACKRGYLDLAREAVDNYDEGRGLCVPDGAKLLALLGAAEIRRGIPIKQLEQLPSKEIQGILAGKNKVARRAVKYFKLHRKVMV